MSIKKDLLRFASYIIYNSKTSFLSRSEAFQCCSPVSSVTGLTIFSNTALALSDSLNKNAYSLKLPYFREDKAQSRITRISVNAQSHIHANLNHFLKI